MKINRAYLMTAALLSETFLFCGCGTAKMEEEKPGQFLYGLSRFSLSLQFLYPLHSCLYHTG